MMEFIKDIHEARMTRGADNQRVLTYSDCVERLYLTVLVLELMRNYPQMRNQVQSYARNTSRHDNYKHFRMNSTDLYNFIYFVDGDDDAIKKLKDPGSARRARARVTLPTMALNGYLSSLATGTNPLRSSQLLINLENKLNINNTEYKSLRRYITTFEGLTANDKKFVVTKLLFAVRAKLRSSDIIDDLEKLAAIKDLEDPRVPDNEPTISTPDIAAGDLIDYRLLVGTGNLMFARKFVEMAATGASIPANIVKSYIPVIKMVTDIVQAGPAFVQQLKILHQKAKKHHNR